ncbi:MAG: lipase maturation factor family protein [Anaerolineae bacterium]
MIVEGTDDGVTWRPYEPRYLPGDVRRPPTLAGVHMPRPGLAAVVRRALRAEGGGAPDWLAQLLDGLKAADPAIVALFARDPFAGRPPRAVRAVLVEDRFSTAAERRASEAWWVRTGGVTWFER